MMKKKTIRNILIFLGIGLCALVSVSFSDYSYTESRAIAKWDTNKDDQIVYSKDFGNIKLLILSGSNGKNVMLVKRKWSLLYKVSNKAMLSQRSDKDKISRTWSGSLVSDKKYETIIAVEVLDTHIKKVIVSNDNIDGQILENLDDIKKASTFFVELEVENGYAVHYALLDPKDVGAYVFRGVYDSGRIIHVGR
ncbi:MAG: hypothetical protein ACQEXQ_26880 [Bacillota bacterium]